MKISFNWLQQFVNHNVDEIETAEILTNLGLEVEGVDKFESIPGSLEGIVVGKVLSCEQHPNADKLKLTSVDIGEKEELQIVCGAHNVREGLNVAVATIGTTITANGGSQLKIKKGKIRGEHSYGMICSENEISIGEDSSGIAELDDDLKPGTPLDQVIEVEKDRIFEIGLTPNRADAMSHWGVARDLRAALIQRGRKIPINTPSISNFHVDDRSRKMKVNVRRSDLAPRYTGVTITGIEISRSPDWLENRLKSIGITPKNNIVDVTNYVMHELGQPLHAFDADKIYNDIIEVKTLKKGTKFTTLDDVERTLSDEDLMICDAEKPLCIAGVLGGKDSGVSDRTKSIFLESAFFDGVTIRKTAKRHGITTDASFRFERGTDPEITEYALSHAALLIKDIAGGKISSDIDDFYPDKFEDHHVFLTFQKINRIIGQVIDANEIKSILSSLEIKVNNISESGIGLSIPPYRNDVRREVDVIEEILRVYGYNNIPLNDRFDVFVANTSKFEDHKIQNLIANQLVSNGFYEMMNNSLTKAEYYQDDEQRVDIYNPLSADLSVMRSSMLYSGLESIRHNINRKNKRLKLFEFGKTYHKPESYQEIKHLTLFITGSKTRENWLTQHEPMSFFYIKGMVISLLQKLGLQNVQAHSTNNELFAEGVSLFYEEDKIGVLGRIDAKISRTFDIEQPVLYADLRWSELLEISKSIENSFQEIPKYPAVRRDFALLIDQDIKFSDIEKTAHQTDKKLLQNIDLFDVYEGEKLPKGKKSYAVSFTFQDFKKTLTDKQVDKQMKKLQQAFEKELDAQLR